MNRSNDPANPRSGSDSNRPEDRKRGDVQAINDQDGLPKGQQDDVDYPHNEGQTGRALTINGEPGEDADDQPDDCRNDPSRRKGQTGEALTINGEAREDG